MLDPDISTADALRHLSAPPSNDPFALDRRRFLQMVGLGLGAGMVAAPGASILDLALPGQDPSAWAAPIGPADGILVVVGMYGGNDGLNTVVPINDGHYQDQHGGLAVPAGDTLPLDGNTGLHPELTEFKSFWDAGQLAIIEGVGHLREDFSHFASMAKWMSGRPTGLPDSGWLGRWTDGYLNGAKDLFAAVEIGNSVPLHVIGQRSIATTVAPSRPDFGVPRSWRSDADLSQYRAVRAMAGGTPAGSWEQRIGAAQVDMLDVAASLNPVIPADGGLSGTEIVAKLQVAARLINANLGIRLVTAGFGDFDSHAGQPFQHGARMRELNAGVGEFFRNLDPRWVGRVTLMTFSEFGRTSFSNDGLGTDHGSSAPQFVIGPTVRGGFHGQRPSLAGLERWQRMPSHVDFRDYYASMIDGWMGGGSEQVLGIGRRDLGLFSSGPTAEITFPPTSIRGEFVGIAPERLYDTRDGKGGRTARIGPGETVRIKIAGAGSVPSDGVAAVAVNLTSIRPVEETFITAFPSGQSRPGSSTVNPRAGVVVPNTSIVGVGSDGSISIYNDRSDVHLTADVLGYFARSGGPSTGALGRMLPLSPARILDTREGVGAAASTVAGGQALRLVVLGRGGVPAGGVDSVVVNLLSIRPTTDGWVTAWPTGAPEPATASLSYRAGRVIPNLTVCKVGADGTIQVRPSHGTVHLVADVVGCFTASGARLAPVAPARLLDTRSGVGAEAARVGAGREIVLRVTGNGVPTEATAVALNVTAVRPSELTYLTVYPDGEARPTASSLNPDPGAVSANLVIAKVGDGGRIRIFNADGDLHLLADLTAYFV